MKYELKDYQEEATAKVINGLRKGSREYAADGEHTAVSLSAPTGAGKTVIAAAVIERLLFGDADTDTPADPAAIFLWLTDDPSLNEQTRKKILEASDRIQPAHMVTLDEGFDQPEFDPGKVYFLNIQKLSRTSKLVVRREGRRTHSIWQTMRNTIESAGSHYYLVIDEAHRGTGKRSREDQSIAQRLLNGSEYVPAAPVALGISATPERFDVAVERGSQQRVPRKVVVPTSAVRESGLIKDVLSISYQAEAQAMEATLVRQAAAALREVDEVWSAYTSSESEPEVCPALVLQIPPNSTPSDIGSLLDICVEEWEALGKHNALAHSLESHTTEQFGRHVVSYVKPENIQDRQAVRLVVFKEALTTGWDCPRAEVMVSLRTAKDDTYIAQLIGRMVRSPLARRIENPETLNRVRLYLPNFDRTAVASVKEKLEQDDGGIPTDVEINAIDAGRNTLVPTAVFDAIEALPSYHVPGPVHRSQVTRLHKLAALLIGDGLLHMAIEAADQYLVDSLNAERARLVSDGALPQMITNVETASVEVLDIGPDEDAISRETHATDTADLNRLFAGARRKLRDGLADKYWGDRVARHGDDPHDARVLTIALSRDVSTVDAIEHRAADRVRQWLDTYGDAISNLSEDKKAKYAEVRSMARQPERSRLSLPKGPITMTGDDQVPGYEKHLYSDGAGLYRARFTDWEKHVLMVESARMGFVGWYRNPTGGQRALRVPYESGAGFGRCYPDFVFVHTDDDEGLRISVIDPHGHHLADASDKLRGLAIYAQRHSASVARVVSVIRNSSGEYRMLDLKDPTIQGTLSGLRTQSEVEATFSDHGAAYS
ncbi:DEAD/DEAH box helicase [Blastococcus sp. SYSU DS0552]